MLLKLDTSSTQIGASCVQIGASSLEIGSSSLEIGASSLEIGATAVGDLAQLIDRGEYKRMGPLRADGEPFLDPTENPEGYGVPNEELSLHILQGPDGEGKARLQARKFAEQVEQRVAKSKL